MRSATKKPAKSTRSKASRGAHRSKRLDADLTIRRLSDEWARHWNARELEGVVSAYAADAVYLPPHHQAVHGRDAIREYLKVPLSHGVSELTFAVTSIKRHGPVAWDVGTYRMSVPQNDGTKKEDHGKYLTVWRQAGKNWLIVADSWSSDLPPSA
jgi:uncharacterized protein (TIGR02246 family)